VEDHRRVLDPLVDAGLQRIVLEEVVIGPSDPWTASVLSKRRRPGPTSYFDLKKSKGVSAELGSDAKIHSRQSGFRPFGRLG